MRVKALTAADKRAKLKPRGNPKLRRITAQEEAYIAAHWGAMTPNQIANALGRHRESVRYVAKRLGLAPIGRPCSPIRSRLVEAKYQEHRADRIDATAAEIRRLCDEENIPAEGVPMSILARLLVRLRRWVPPNIHVAADLGDDGLFRPQPASEPCEALPGTLERVEAYAARVEAGEEIWCERDRRE